MAEDPELETELAKSWNTFMATQCAKSDGRLFFAAVIPYRRPGAAVAEIRRVKALGGAVGIYTHGIEWDMPLENPEFWLYYEGGGGEEGWGGGGRGGEGGRRGKIGRARARTRASGGRGRGGESESKSAEAT